MGFLATLIDRGISHIDGAAAGSGPKYSPDSYCGRRLAGLETGPIPNRGPETSAGLWILVSFSTTFLAARLYLKWYRLKGLWWDDYFLVLAWFIHTLSATPAQVSISLFGLGHYPCDVPSPATSIPRLTLVGDHFGAMFSMFAVALSKTSWAVTLLRLVRRGSSTSSSSSSPSSTTSSSSSPGKHQRQYAVWIVWFVIITICLIKGAQGVLVWIPKCGSPQAAAALGGDSNDVSNVSRHDVCVRIEPLNGFATFAGSVSGTYAILLAVVPWKTIWGTNLGKREKVGVATTMSVGAVSGVAAFVLAVKMRRITSENFTYDSGAIIVWSTAETSTTIMAACIPVHRAFCRQLRKKLLAQNRWHSSKQHSTPPETGKNGIGGSTTLTTLNSGNFHSVPDKLSQHGRTGSDCLSVSSGGGGCHAATDDNASDKAILQVRDIESCDISGSEVATSRNSERILMTQEVKVEYYHHPEILYGRDVLEEEAQPQHVYALKDMGTRGDPYKGINDKGS